ncbi:hypothetical protein CH063_08952, partial [Colletotrichum higginsianum]
MGTFADTAAPASRTSQEKHRADVASCFNASEPEQYLHGERPHTTVPPRPGLRLQLYSPKCCCPERFVVEFESQGCSSAILLRMSSSHRKSSSSAYIFADINSDLL